MVNAKMRWDFIGLSTDNKPTPDNSSKVVDGSTYYCSDNSKLYVFCRNNWYERKPLGGGSDITVVQTTGNSTTSVMSQNAVTEALANAGAFKTLTTADYNYPVENPDGIAFWLLDPGHYQTSGTMKLYTEGQSGSNFSNSVGLEVISKPISGQGGTRGCYIYSTGNASFTKIVTDIDTNGSNAVVKNIPTLVINNLTDNSTSNALSANQGKVLKGLIDATAPAVFYADKTNFTTAADNITLYFDDSLDTAATTAQVHAVVSSGRPLTVITRDALQDDERSTFNLVDSQYPKFCTDGTMDDYGMHLNFIDIALGKIIKLDSYAMPNDNSDFTAFITNL